MLEYCQSNEEIANSVVPVNYGYKVGDPRRYGAVLDGATDDIAAFNAALSIGLLDMPMCKAYLSGELSIHKATVIKGKGGLTWTTELRFDENCDGIRLYTGGTCRIDGVYLYCKAEQIGSTGNGITANAQLVASDVLIRNFNGNGIVIEADAGLYGSNANGWSLNKCRVSDCGGDGLYLSGADANAGIAIGCEFASNSGRGINDESKLGNTYLGTMTENNTLGDIRTNSTVGYGVFLSCYTENESAKSKLEFTGPTFVVGGFAALNSYNTAATIRAGVGPYAGLNLNSDGLVHFNKIASGEIARIDLDEKKISGLRIGVFGDSNDCTIIGPNAISMRTSTSANQDRLTFDVPGGRAGAIQTTNLKTIYKSST